MADERNAAALTEEGASEASATSTTSGGDDVAQTLPLDLAEEEETRAAYAREVLQEKVAKWHEEEEEYDARWHGAWEMGARERE